MSAYAHIAHIEHTCLTTHIMPSIQVVVKATSVMVCETFRLATFMDATFDEKKRKTRNQVCCCALNVHTPPPPPPPPSASAFMGGWVLVQVRTDLVALQQSLQTPGVHLVQALHKATWLLYETLALLTPSVCMTSEQALVEAKTTVTGTYIHIYTSTHLHI